MDEVQHSTHKGPLLLRTLTHLALETDQCIQQANGRIVVQVAAATLKCRVRPCAQREYEVARLAINQWLTLMRAH